MNILAFSSLYPPFFRGGYELAAFNFLEGLKQRGNHVTLVTSNYGDCTSQKEPDVIRCLHYLQYAHLKPNIETRLKPIFNVFNKFRRIIYTFSNYHMGGKIIRRIRPDIIYLWDMREISYETVYMAKKLNIPTVLHIEDKVLPTVRSRYLLPVDMILGKPKYNFDHIICTSETMKHYAVSNGLPAKITSVVPNGIDPDWIVSSIAAKGNISRLLYVGRLNHDKGVHVAIEALRFLDSKTFDPVTLSIIGEGEKQYVDYLKELIIQWKLENKVFILGHHTHAKIKTLYSNYDILLVPSIYVEPFGLIIIEAMSRGIPVIASNLGGPGEIISHETNGMLFQPGDARELADKIKTLVLNKKLYEKVRQNALEHINRNYLISDCVQKAESILSEVKKNTMPL